MTEELTKLSEFLVTYGKPNSARNQNENQVDHGEFLQTTFAKLRKWLEQRISKSGSKEALGIFVKQTQLQLTARANDTYNAIRNIGKGNNPMANVFREIHSELIAMLEYLHLHYADYFDHSIAIPLGMPQTQANESSIHDVLLHFGATGADPNLIELLNDLLNATENGDPKDTTWAHYEYRSELAKQLRAASASRARENDPTFALIEVLISCNVNHISFYNYMMEYIDETVDTNTTFEEKEDELEMLLKKIERIRVSENMAFHLKVQNIHDSLRGNIVHELERIQRTKHAINNHGENTDDPHDRFHFNVAATIEELLLLIWVMIEVGFIKTLKHSRMYTFIHNHVRTDRTDHPSTKYMRNHFGPTNVPERVVRNVRAWLTHMVQFIDDYFRGQKKK